MASFPPGFLFGAATSSYQIEGAVHEDGRGESIWDRFCATPGKIRDGDTGEVACDHYHRWPEDLDLIRDLGLGAYRFSIAWPRIQPEGRGRPSAKGIAFYDRLVDGMLERGIQPYATLYHWDLPQALEDEGGWRNRDTAHAFADYAEIMAEILGDRVTAFATLNEPFCSAFVSHLWGEHAPGMRDLPAALQAHHNLLLAHGLAMPRLRLAAPKARHGIVLNFTPAYPATDSAADREAARLADGFSQRLFTDPIFRGTYPDDVVERLDDAFPKVPDGDLAIIAAPLDFLGLNYYTRSVVAHDPGPDAFLGHRTVQRDVPRTAMGWEVYPQGLTDLLRQLHADYDLPDVYVCENGAAYEDRLVDGSVDDPERVAYIDAHLQAIAAAIRDGVPVRGYFAWSLMDNFEWAHGYAYRFGLVHVDFATQARTLKRSGRWFRDFIAAQRAPAAVG